MVSCAERIVEGLSRDPIGIATSLLTRGLIDNTVCRQTMKFWETKVTKARRLYTIILDVVKNYAEKYDDFVAILREHGVYADLLELLEIKGMITAVLKHYQN